LTNSSAPKTPFELARYRLAADRRAQHLELRAAADSAHAKDANERADNYMLAVVLFASSLFFAGLSTKLHTSSAKLVLLGLGAALFLGTVIWLATLPAQLPV
jgi:hypothetical protein